MAASRVARALHVQSDHSFQILPHRLARLAFDTLDSLRLGRAVPSFGNVAAVQTPPRRAARAAARVFGTHRSRHAMVGLHIGLDLIERGNGFTIVELNTLARVQWNQGSVVLDVLLGDVFDGHDVCSVKRRCSTALRRA